MFDIISLLSSIALASNLIYEKNFNLPLSETDKVFSILTLLSSIFVILVLIRLKVHNFQSFLQILTGSTIILVLSIALSSNVLSDINKFNINMYLPVPNYLSDNSGFVSNVNYNLAIATIFVNIIFVMTTILFIKFSYPF